MARVIPTTQEVKGIKCAGSLATGQDPVKGMIKRPGQTAQQQRPV